VQGSRKQSWATNACKIIKEGQAFAQCRERIGGSVTETYYKNCIGEACS
jgi:hypothetical protein